MSCEGHMSCEGEKRTFQEELSRRQAEINRILEAYLPEETGYQATLFKAMNYSMRCGGKRLRPLFIAAAYELFAGAAGEPADREDAAGAAGGPAVAEDAMNAAGGPAGGSAPCGGQEPDSAPREDGTVTDAARLPRSLSGAPTERYGAAAPFMAAMEMIHTHSLIHDDLPAMDNDDLRRGQPTNHRVFGEAMAILAGDGLLSYGCETAVKAFAIEPGNPRVAEAMRILTEKVGIYGMIGGQSCDVEHDGQPLSEGQLDFIYHLKTAALIEGSLMIGAVLGGATDAQVKILEEIGTHVGIAFQIRDDILDVTGDEAAIGKPAHSDEKNAKTTYVTLHSLEEAEAEVERRSRAAVELLSQLPGDTAFLRQLLESLIRRSA